MSAVTPTLHPALAPPRTRDFTPPSRVRAKFASPGRGAGSPSRVRDVGLGIALGLLAFCTLVHFTALADVGDVGHDVHVGVADAEEFVEREVAAIGAAAGLTVAAGERPPAQAVGAAHSECARRRPYHVVLTAASGLYQEWQTRVAYHQYRKLKAESPCSDLGGFTRLLNTPNQQPDGLMDEVPTVVVKQLKPGRCDECDHGFVVMNRPWGVLQLLEHEAWGNIAEEEVLLMETDHLLLRAPPNRATATKPVGFGFYYMTYRYDPPKLKPVIAKYHNPDEVDPVGPSPVIISKAQLRQVARPWWELCLTLKRDKEANDKFGWVLEMWGWALATARLGIRHTVVPELQAEPGGDGIRDLSRFFIYHYTFDLGQAGGSWRWSKRDFMGRYPTAINEPPRASTSTKAFIGIVNDAIRSLPAWGKRVVPKAKPI